MLKGAASKVMWVGRATVFLVGLAVILALLFGVASTAFAHKGDTGFFHLGHRNFSETMSTLVRKGAGPALRLQVESGAPLKVNSSEKVVNLNADELDGKSEEGFYAAGSKVDDSAHADHADTSGTATSAQNADDAAKLGGAAASDYVRSNDPRLSNPTIAFNVTSNSSVAWLINNPSDYVSGSNVNPTLTLTRGMTYRFNVNVNGHPFRIASSSSGPAFNVGVTNNDVMNGTLTFKVPMDAPSQLYYYCLAHPGMNGVINIS